VGTVPSPELAAHIAGWIAPRAIASELVGSASLPVTVSSGTLPDGGRAWFVFNWGWSRQDVTLSAPVTDLVTGGPLEAGTALSLDGWSTRAFVSR
jgi:beta-galactosidase